MSAAKGWSFLFPALALFVAPFAPQCSAVAAYEAKICFVVRTYWRHGGGGDRSLNRLLRSLQRSTHANWEAVLVVLDSKPFVDLPALLLELDDDRIWVFADAVSADFAAKNLQGNWHSEYHFRLYELTDEAIRRGCPPDARWVVATNGDNEYGAHFMEEIVKADAVGAELVAFDYYTRYYRPTAPPCERFRTGNGLPCKENLLRFCQTDLSANAMRRRKLVKGNYRFADSRNPHDAASSDGFLMERLTHDGWIVRRVSIECLVAHNPTPQTCSQEGFVWDDRMAASSEESGGKCITSSQAHHILFSHPEVEQVSVNIPLQGLFYENSSNRNDTSVSINCLRWKDRSRDIDFFEFFGTGCAAPMDAAVGVAVDSEKEGSAYEADHSEL